MVLEALGEGLRNAISKLLRSTVADRETVRELVREIQRVLLSSDVNVELVLRLSENIERRAFEEELPPGVSRREHIVKIVYEELAEILGSKPRGLNIKPGQLNVIMLVGIQGSGKTTTAAKLARYLAKRGFKTGLVCADTFRLGAYEQLSQLADAAGIPFYGDIKSKSSVDVAKKGIEYFRGKGYDVVIVDTAGRHKNEADLMEEMKDIARAIKPTEIMLVVDGTLGQQAMAQARAFKEATDVGSIIVTKLDGTARGGGALSAVAATSAPIKFIGVGEKLDDIEAFDPVGFVGRLLGMGDLRALLEKVREAEIKPEREEALSLLTGRFTLKDFYKWMEQARKMGPVGKLFELMGLSSVPKELRDVAEAKLDKWKVIMQSMTMEELEDPKILNRSRVNRIARGSGTTPKEVKELVDQYFAAKKMVKALGKRRMRGKGMPIRGVTPEQLEKLVRKL
ncbi:MAG: signal recognition particle protein Srp54 [Candidatus Jordarchaeales archaeon]|nr:signal recognition particle protein Srp54 [Candidatus Jordarchaeia archaeon]